METKIHQKYGDLRFRDSPIGRPLVSPDDFQINPSAVEGHLERKSPHRLIDLFPNIDDFRTVSTDLFTSKEIMRREWDTVWKKRWLFAGLASDVADKGDWFTYEIGTESFIIVRGRDEKVRGFYNVCRHRGNRLVREEAGSACAAFTCGFHSWSWDTRGRNVRVTDKETYCGSALSGDLNLPEVSVEIAGAFVFINLASDPVPLSEYLSGIWPTLDSYRIEEMRLLRDVKIPVDANWKVAMNAFQESYHVHAQHPQMKCSTDDFNMQFDFYTYGHSRMITQQAVVSLRQNDRTTINDGIRDMLVTVGIDPDSLAGGAAEARTAIQKAKRATDPEVRGIDYSRYTDSQLTDIWSGQIFPNLTFSAQPEGLLWQQFKPHPSDPEKSVYHVMIFARGGLPQRMGSLAGIDASASRVPREAALPGETGTYEVLEQDVDAIPVVQEGLRSQSLPFIRLSEQEGRLQHFFAELDRCLSGAAEAAEMGAPPAADASTSGAVRSGNARA